MELTEVMEIPAGIGEGVGNALRQIAMGSLNCWDVVAISIGEDSNILSTAEDTQQIMGAIKNVTFKPKSDFSNLRPLVVIDFSVTGSFKLSDLDNPYFDILFEEDYEFIHTLDNLTVPVQIYLLNSSGNRSSIKNRDTLSLLGVNLESLIVSSSRHIVVNKFTVETRPIRTDMHGDKEELQIEISSKVMDPKEVLLSSITILTGQLGNLKDQLI